MHRVIPALVSLTLTGAAAQAQTLPRKGALPLEAFPGVEVVYIAIRNPKGPLQRAILTRPQQTTSRRPAILFVPWLSCDSVESPKGAAPGIDRIAAASRRRNALRDAAGRQTGRRRQ